MSATGPRPVLFTGDIFRQQARGGITRYVLEITQRLARPSEIVLGVHQSVELAGSAARLRAGLRLPAFRGAHRVAALVNPVVDTALVRGRRGVILHPSYYRDPDALDVRSPLVVTVHDMTHERLPEQFGGRWWSAADPARHKAALCARADRVLCNSETTRRDVLELLRLPESKVRLTPHASRDWSAIAPAPIPALEEPFFLWVGPRHAYKNFEPTLAAWAACSAAAGTGLLCVGGGAFRAEERARIAALGVEERVLQRAASDAELRCAYDHAAALVYTSLWEGFGVPVVEALSLGCPVVTSDRAPLREVGGDAALYVESTDPASLADGLTRALGADRAPDAVARRRAQAARFSWDRCAAEHEAVYRELE